VLSIINSAKLKRDTNIDLNFTKSTPPLYRFMIIIDGSDESYVEKFKKGVTDACLDSSVAFEFWDFKGDSKDENILRQFDIAIESKVDGIIIQPFEDDRFDEILGKANYYNIPTITIDTDIPTKEKVCFISYNRYQISTEIGKLLNTELNKNGEQKGTIIVIQNEQNYNYDEAIALNQVIDDKYSIKVEELNYTGENLLNAGGLTRNIIDKYDDLVGIICSSGEETFGAIQALKDTNKMNDVAVVGFDNSKEIIEYIDRGVILATVVAENEKLGYEAIENMVKHKNKEFVSMYHDITVDIITKENVDEYKVELGEENDN
jgi:ribose transport system substrate-binding protein